MGIEVIAGIIAGAGVSGGIGIFGSEIAFSTIAAYALTGGALVGGTLLTKELGASKKHENEQQTLKQSLPARQRGYGQALVAGSYYFYSAAYNLYSGFILCEGPIEGVLQHWFNDQISPEGENLGGTTQYGQAGMWPWYSQVDFIYQNGSPDQGPNGLLAEAFAWQGCCKGLVNTVVRCTLPSNPSKNFAKFFPSGVPQYRAVLQLSVVYDPRVSSQSWTDNTTWSWSDNSALCILDYLTNARAMAIPTAQIDVASFIAAANVAAEQVPLAAGGAEPRYRVWMMYGLDEEPKDVLARLLKTCDGELYMTPAGQIALRGGVWTEPTVTITADMVLALEAHRGRDKLAKYNQLKIRYQYAFDTSEGDPWDDLVAQTAAGQVLPQDFDGGSIPSYPQCLRLAKIQMSKDNPDWLFTVTTNIAGLNALGERIVTFDFPDLGFDGTCFVNSFEIGEDGATCKIGLGSLDSSAYEWSTTEEGTASPANATSNATPYVPPAPTDLELSLNRVSTGDGGFVSTLQAQIDTPSDTTLGLVAQYRLDGTTAWSDMTVDNATYTATSPPVSDQSTYDVQVALVSYGGTEGPFVEGTMQVISDATSPGPPTDFTATQNVDGSATLSWTNPNAANYFATKIYRGASSNESQASVIATDYGSAGSQRSVTVQPQSGQNFYWAMAVNRSNVGDSAGPLEVDAP